MVAGEVEILLGGLEAPVGPRRVHPPPRSASWTSPLGLNAGASIALADGKTPPSSPSRPPPHGRGRPSAKARFGRSTRTCALARVKQPRGSEGALPEGSCGGDRREVHGVGVSPLRQVYASPYAFEGGTASPCFAALARGLREAAQHFVRLSFPCRRRSGARHRPCPGRKPDATRHGGPWPSPEGSAVEETLAPCLALLLLAALPALAQEESARSAGAGPLPDREDHRRGTEGGGGQHRPRGDAAARGGVLHRGAAPAGGLPDSPPAVRARRQLRPAQGEPARRLRAGHRGPARALVLLRHLVRAFAVRRAAGPARTRLVHGRPLTSLHARRARRGAAVRGPLGRRSSPPLDSEEGVQVGFTQYDLFHRGILASAGYSRNWLLRHARCSPWRSIRPSPPGRSTTPTSSRSASPSPWAAAQSIQISRQRAPGRRRHPEEVLLADAPPEQPRSSMGRGSAWTTAGRRRSGSTTPATIRVLPTRGFSVSAGLEAARFASAGPRSWTSSIPSPGPSDRTPPLLRSEQVVAAVSVHPALAARRPARRVSLRGRSSPGRSRVENLDPAVRTAHRPARRSTPTAARWGCSTPLTLRRSADGEQLHRPAPGERRRDRAPRRPPPTSAPAPCERFSASHRPRLPQPVGAGAGHLQLPRPGRGAAVKRARGAAGRSLLLLLGRRRPARQRRAGAGVEAAREGLVLSRLPPILGEEEVRKQLGTGLTTSFVFEANGRTAARRQGQGRAPASTCATTCGTRSTS